MEEKKKTKKTLIIILVLLLVCVGGYFGYKYYQQVQLEKADAEAKALRMEIVELIKNSTSVVEINESEAESFDMNSIIKTDERMRVEWEKELDHVHSDNYPFVIYATTEQGNEISAKGNVSVIIIDDVAPVINVSTNEFMYQVREKEAFDVEIINTIVGDVKDTKDGTLKFSKTPRNGAYHIEIYDDVDTEHLADGQEFMVIIVATDKAGNQAYENITVKCSKDEVENPEPEKHEHKWSSWTTTKEATCTGNGTRERKCTDPNCDEVQREIITALGHSVKWKTTKEATCTESGNREGKCSRCGNTINETIKALGHSYKVTEEVKADCEHAGHKTEKCSRCGDTKTTNYNALGHNYQWKTITEATHSRKGEYHHKCANCGKVDQKKYKEWIVDSPAWDETIHHDAVTRQEEIRETYIVYIYCFRDGRPDLEIEKYPGFDPQAYFESLGADCFRYYSQHRYRVVGYETIIVTPAWDEIVHHDEVGHWNEWTDSL